MYFKNKDITFELLTVDFKLALQLVLQNEGGYVNDQNDSGGETYKGVARNMNSNWVSS